ncbi:putative secondary metabolism biosynthetic enzyme [Amphichorda felina]
MFPPPPASDIDWKNVDLSLKIPVKGHVEARHNASTGTWSAPILETNPNISVSGISPALNYGQQCFEGLKAYRQASGDIVIFRPEVHAARIAKSAVSVCLPPPPKDLFVECVRAAVAANAELVPPSSSNGALYIRPVLFGSSAQLALAPPEESILAVYVYPLLPYHGSAATDALVLEDFDRTAPFGTGPFKVGGNYAPVWKHAAAAKEKGYGITLHVDSATRTKIDEFSTSGFLGFKSDGSSEKTLIVPLAENAVQSVTSASLTRIAELQGWTIQRDEVPLDTLPSIQEVVAVGTVAVVVPIRSISRLSTSEKFTFPGTSDPEKIESQLLGLARTLSEIVRGDREDIEGWCWKVTEHGGVSTPPSRL